MTAAANDMSIKTLLSGHDGMPATTGYEGLGHRQGAGIEQVSPSGTVSFQSSWQSIMSTFENVAEELRQDGEGLNVPPDVLLTASRKSDVSSKLRSTQAAVSTLKGGAAGAL